MSKSVKQKSLNAQLRSIANPNRCCSKMGTNISQLFFQLKVKEAGVISALNTHDSA